MQCILTALKAESSPIIHHFNLQRDNRFSFPVFQNGDVWLIGIGVGKKNISHRINQFYSTISPKNVQWINIGIAGGTKDETTIGELYLIHRLIDPKSQKSYYPDVITNHSLPVQVLYTVDKPVTDGGKPFKGLVDMEASEIYNCIRNQSDNHSISFLKIVSDWMGPDVHHLDAIAISSFIESNIYQIEHYLEAFKKIS